MPQTCLPWKSWRLLLAMTPLLLANCKVCWVKVKHMIMFGTMHPRNRKEQARQFPTCAKNGESSCWHMCRVQECTLLQMMWNFQWKRQLLLRNLLDKLSMTSTASIWGCRLCRFDHRYEVSSVMIRLAYVYCSYSLTIVPPLVHLWSKVQ